ncbi:MAG: CBS domain-containing protein [Actinomycetota bacterium]
MRIGDIYRRGVFTVQASDTLAHCARRLEVAAVGALGVVEGSDIVGIISERDLVLALSRRDDPRGALVREFMSVDLLTADVDEAAREVAHRMLDAGIRHLPVAEEGNLVGMVSMRDLLHLETWG